MRSEEILVTWGSHGWWRRRPDQDGEVESHPWSGEQGRHESCRYDC